MSNYTWKKLLNMKKSLKDSFYNIGNSISKGKKIDMDVVMGELYKAHEMGSGKVANPEYVRGLLEGLIGEVIPNLRFDLKEARNNPNKFLEMMQNFLKLSRKFTHPYARLVKDLPDEIRTIRKETEKRDEPVSLDALAEMEIIKLDQEKD